MEYALTADGRELAGALRLLADWGSQRGGTGEPLRHEACGTPLEARWHCPTCDRSVSEPETRRADPLLVGAAASGARGDVDRERVERLGALGDAVRTEAGRGCPAGWSTIEPQPRSSIASSVRSAAATAPRAWAAASR